MEAKERKVAEQWLAELTASAEAVDADHKHALLNIQHKQFTKTMRYLGFEYNGNEQYMKDENPSLTVGGLRFELLESNGSRHVNPETLLETRDVGEQPDVHVETMGWFENHVQWRGGLKVTNTKTKFSNTYRFLVSNGQLHEEQLHAFASVIQDVQNGSHKWVIEHNGRNTPFGKGFDCITFGRTDSPVSINKRAIASASIVESGAISITLIGDNQGCSFKQLDEEFYKKVSPRYMVETEDPAYEEIAEYFGFLFQNYDDDLF